MRKGYPSKLTKANLLFIGMLLMSAASFSQNPLTPAQGFNVFTQNGATLVTNESEGPVAIGGDLTLRGDYRVSTNYTGTFTVNGVKVTLVVGGKVIYQSGNGLTVNQNGYVKIGDAQVSKTWYTDQNNAYSPIRITPGTDYNGSPRINLQANAQQLGVSAANNPVTQSDLIDFTAAFATMKASSLSIAACTDNANLTNANGNPIAHTNLPNQVKINLATGINTLNVTAADLANIQDFVYNNQPDANHVLIFNINAPGTFDWKVWNSGGIGFNNSPYVLYNFYNTTTLNIAGNGSVEGTVFAPFADVIKTANQANIEGQLIAQSFLHSGGEMHYGVFNANVAGCAVSCNLSVSGSAKNISCYNSANGTIVLSPTGATGSVSYIWSDNSTEKDRSELAPGTYSVVATDENGCKASADFTITQPDALAVTGVTINNAMVNATAGSIDITVTGGTNPYTYLWNDNATTEDRTALTQGKYTVVVTDENKCTTSEDFNITDPVCNIALTHVETSTTCFAGNDGAIDITVTGANGNVSYLWNDSVTTEDRSNIYANYYSVTATDAAGCSITSETIHVHRPSKVNGTYKVTKPTAGKNCDAIVILTGSGGRAPYRYQWQDGFKGATRKNLCPGIYYAGIIDKNGCIDTLRIMVPKTVVSAAMATTLSAGNSLSVTVSPNPLKGVGTVNINSITTGKAVLNVYSAATGSKVLSVNVDLLKGSNTSKLDLSKLAQGVYELQLVTGESTAHVKLLVE